MRLFVALYPPVEAIDHLSRRLGDLRTGADSDARLAVPDEMHVTLAFLGEVEDARLPAVEAALASATPRPAPTDPAPLLRLGGGGSFTGGRSTVLWVGLVGDRSALLRLADAVRRELEQVGMPYDPRPFRPHLTLARIRRPEPGAIEDDRSTLDRYAGPPWPMTEMALVSRTR